MKFGTIARAILAAAISPLSVLIAAPIILLSMGLSHHWPIPLDIVGILATSAYITIFAYGATIILGLPTYFILRHFSVFFRLVGDCRWNHHRHSDSDTVGGWWTALQ